MNPLLTTAILAARTAGKIIMASYGNTDSTQKADQSPVTEADLHAHTCIADILDTTNIPVLSEESADVDFPTLPYPAKLWVVDPLDGTRDFIQGTGDFSVMISLLHAGEPVLAVVYAPVHDMLYYAEKGAGAYKIHNEVTLQLKVSDAEKPNLRFICSRNHFTPYMDAVAKSLQVVSSVPHGSVGIKASILAQNEGDFFFYSGALGVWDVCAPQLIATESGGTVTDLDGNPLSYNEPNHRIPNGVVFSNTACHTAVLAVLQDTPR